MAMENCRFAGGTFMSPGRAMLADVEAISGRTTA
jgi:hypothetical protein